jgi:nitrous oxide reductase
MTDKTEAKKTEDVIADRRNFLKFAGASAVTGTAAVVGAGGVMATPVAEAKPTDGDYRETAHVKRYYELAR